MAPSGICRVSGCTQNGLFFKRLDKHLKRVHPGITMEKHKTFPAPNPTERNIRKKSSADRHVRRPCRVPGCRYYNVLVSRLSDHLRRRHAPTFQEHESLYSSSEFSSENWNPVQKADLKSSLRDLVATLPGACYYWEHQD